MRKACQTRRRRVPPPLPLLPLNKFTFQPARKVLALVHPTGSLKRREIFRKKNNGHRSELPLVNIVNIVHYTFAQTIFYRQPPVESVPITSRRESCEMNLHPQKGDIFYFTIRHNNNKVFEKNTFKRFQEQRLRKYKRVRKQLFFCLPFNCLTTVWPDRKLYSPRDFIENISICQFRRPFGLHSVA